MNELNTPWRRRYWTPTLCLRSWAKWWAWTAVN